MSSAPLLVIDKYLLEILDGPDKGAQFQLVAGEIKIGRGDTNDVILNDPRCSREHAVIKITPQAILIEDRGSSTGLSVDGQKGTRAFLANGSKIEIGSTSFVFKKITTHAKNSIPQEARFNVPTHSKSKSKIDSKKITFYMIFGAILLFGFYMYTATPPKPIETTTPTVDEEIELSKKRQDALIKEQMQNGKASRQYLDAQAAYTKGLRDYREGLYKSAIINFSAALAIYPEHPTAKRYLRLTQVKLDGKIQFLMQEGSRFMEQNKYQNAKAAFNSVLILINDKENKIYQEALEKHNECVLLLRESF